MPHSPRQEQRQALHQLSRRLTLALSAVVGALAGLMAVFFRLLVELVETVHTQYFPELWDEYHYFGLAAMIAGGALLGVSATYVTSRFCEEAAGSGIPQVKTALMTGGRMRYARLIVTKLVGGLVAIAGGFSLGREGPTVHIGAAVAEGFSVFYRLPGRTRRALIAAGAGAGLAAAFNAPLAGFLFVMEELRRDMSRGTYGNALVTAVTSVGVSRFCLGNEATFEIPDLAPLPVSAVPGVIVIGIAGTFVGLIFNKALLRAVRERKYGLLKGAVAGALGAVLALTLPQATGGGSFLLQELLTDSGVAHWNWSPVLLLLVVKLCFTVLCYGTGVPGGIFAPLLSLGALLGCFMGDLLYKSIPSLSPDPQHAITIGMAAVLTASVRSPLTGVVLIVEMTGQYHTLYSLLLVAFVANVLSEQIHLEPIYEALVKQGLPERFHPSQGEARVMEVLIEEASPLDGSPIKSLGIADQLHIASVVRGETTLVPHGNLRLRGGDFLTLVVPDVCSPTTLLEFMEKSRVE